MHSIDFQWGAEGGGGAFFWTLYDYSPWPSLKGHNSKQREHGVTNIVKVKVMSLPLSLHFLKPNSNLMKREK